MVGSDFSLEALVLLCQAVSSWSADRANITGIAEKEVLFWLIRVAIDKNQKKRGGVNSTRYTRVYHEYIVLIITDCQFGLNTLI